MPSSGVRNVLGGQAFSRVSGSDSWGTRLIRSVSCLSHVS